MSKVFLGGSRSDWRSKITSKLNKDYYSPNLTDITVDGENNELKNINECDIHYYYLDNHFRGFISIAEMIQSSCKGIKTVVNINDKNFTPMMKHSIAFVKDILESNGATVFYNKPFDSIVDYLNSL